MTTTRQTVAGVAVAAALFTASAAPAAPAITDEQLASLKIGATTYSEVVAKFGRAQTVESSSDGSKILTYSVMRTHVKGATFIPIVGLFAGGASSTVVVDRFEFRPDGTLSKMTTSDTAVQCKIFGGCGSAPDAPLHTSVASTPTTTEAPSGAPIPAAVRPAPPSQVAAVPASSAAVSVAAPAPEQAAPTKAACGMVPQRDGSVKLVPCR
jgi:hypothetical protein